MLTLVRMVIAATPMQIPHVVSFPVAVSVSGWVMENIIMRLRAVSIMAMDAMMCAADNSGCLFLICMMMKAASQQMMNKSMSVIIMLLNSCGVLTVSIPSAFRCW